MLQWFDFFFSLLQWHDLFPSEHVTHTAPPTVFSGTAMAELRPHKSEETGTSEKVDLCVLTDVKPKGFCFITSMVSLNGIF